MSKQIVFLSVFAFLSVSSLVYGQCSSGNCSSGQRGQAFQIPWQLQSQNNCPGGNCSVGQKSGCPCPAKNCPTECGKWACICNNQVQSQGNCPGGNCNLQNGVNMQVAKPVLQKNGWFENVLNGRVQIVKYQSGKQVGNWDVEGAFFRSYDEGTKVWGEVVTTAPQDLPEKYKPKEKVIEKKVTIEKAETSDKLPSWMTNGVELATPSKFTENTYIIDGKKFPETSFTGSDETPVCPDLHDRKWLTAFAKDPAMREKIKKDFQASGVGNKVWAQVLSPESWAAQSHKISESKQFNDSGVCYFFQNSYDDDRMSTPIWAEYKYMTPEDIGRKIDKDFHPDDVPSSSRSSNGGAGNLLVPVALGGIILFGVMGKKKDDDDVEEED